MKQKKTLILMAVLAIFGLVGFGVYKYMQPQSVHYHAAFHVYKNNQLLDFSKIEYMSLVPCGKETTDFVHLHENIGDVIHVHRADATWQHALEYIRETDATNITLYVNGEKNPQLHQKIQNYDRALILIGQATDIETKLSQVPDETKIKAAESASELCGNKEE